jgi:2'-5' RNA ligase
MAVSRNRQSFRRNTLHMTLQAIAGLNEPYPTLLGRARLAASDLPAVPFELCFDGLMTFGDRPGSRALVLATDGSNDHVTDLAAALHQALDKAGFPLPRLSKIVPHITFA